MDLAHSSSVLVSAQDYSYRLSVVIGEQSSQMQELRKQAALTEEELQQLKRDKERATGTETDHLQGLLREKEAFIKVRSRSAAVRRSRTCSSSSHPPKWFPSGADEGSGGVHAAILQRQRG